jgi:hypothetical protein
MPTEIELVDQAIVRISKGWTQGAFARDAAGRECQTLEEDPVCWCLAGSLMVGRVPSLKQFPEQELVVLRLHRKIRETMGSPFGIISWNDTPSRTKEAVLSLLRAVRTDLGVELIEQEKSQ